ncbi:serine--tRNA ligase [bacterium]|nr:serine--tRNA ligase [bacterium]|tara:strand:+ start:3532 stop:4758 length:1227 start_codon:yes stop_codon:yes gene_type:complete
MIDPKRLNHAEDLLDELNRRGDCTAVVEKAHAAYHNWKSALQAFETLKADQNAATPKRKPTDVEKNRLAELSDAVKTAKRFVDDAEQAYRTALLYVPNIPDPKIPTGADASGNTVFRTPSRPVPEFAFEPQTHDSILERLNWIDTTRTARINGSRFVTYCGLGARLKRALIQFMLDHNTHAGYHELSPPVLVNRTSLTGTGQLPKFDADLFHCTDTDYWLSPTAEVQLTNYYQGELIAEASLPIKLTGYTPCFRKEAGSYGRDTKGLIRLHQFDKVELVQLVKPETSDAALLELLNTACGILDALELPYQVVTLCSGDLGFSASKTYDIEVWLPAQNTYRELSSCSLFTDFQARRANIRYRGDSNTFVHTINGSGLAIDRTIAAIIENYQLADGSVSIPKCLDRYMSV